MTVLIGTKQATILEFPRKITGLLGEGLSDGTEPGAPGDVYTRLAYKKSVYVGEQTELEYENG